MPVALLTQLWQSEMSSGVAKCPITGQYCPWLRTTGLKEHRITIPCVAGLGKGIHGERKSKCSCSVVFNSLQLHGLQPARLLCPWGFSRQETWNWLPFPSPGELPDPGIEPRSPALQADSLPSESPGKSVHGRTSLIDSYFWFSSIYPQEHGYWQWLS